jgi:hypothetical protein
LAVQAVNFSPLLWFLNFFTSYGAQRPGVTLPFSEISFSSMTTHDISTFKLNKRQVKITHLINAFAF